MHRSTTAACLVLCAVLGAAVAQTVDDVTRQCLDCICQASTKCNTKLACTNAGPNSYYCGPYQISYAYWVDAGKPGDYPHFEGCLKDKRCSEATVVNYMNKWGTDCDGDGVVTCYDYARMHKAGRTGCPATWVDSTDYWDLFEQCMGGNQAGGLDARRSKPKT
ncbi:lysozyme 2 [Ixodes scapularis]|uniref:lysozyme 2 n=1 Tax=Ixodes scapularis TaxID=6945 RepID=UPI001C391993|nr:lysozyme 2 [Ixodes scapularis]